jgi:glucarate dehydratase
MKITDLKITPIAVSDPPLLNAAGLHAPYALRTIIEVETDAGITGLSEIPGNIGTDEALAEAREAVLGLDPFHLSRTMRTITQQFGKETRSERGLSPWDSRKIVHVQSALEVACLDIIGKDTGRPVVDLLGGPVREQVPFSAYLFFKHKGAGGELEFETDPNAAGWAAARQAEGLTPEQMVAQAQGMIEEYGFQSIKLKGGALEPALEVASILALRDAFPDAPLRLDPNAIWKVETAAKWAKELEGVLEYFEDPVRGQKNMAELKKHTSIPLATNMCTTSFEDLPTSIALGSEDIILSDHHFWGGLKASIELSRICETFGRGMSMHSNSHVGISLAAMVHLGAAAPHLTYALDTHYPWQEDEVIVGGKMKFEEGAVTVSREPGLGVELDRTELARLHENYKRCGLTHRNDEIEMQKVEPGWKFAAVRW